MNINHHIGLLSITFLSVLIIACNSQSEIAEKAANEVVENTDPGSISISKSQFSSSGMQLGKMGMHEFSHIIKTNGTIDVPPSNKASVSAYFGGYIKELDLLPGEKVQRGQLLFVLENPEYVQIQQDFLEAKGQLKYLESDYERQKSMVAENVTSQKNFLKAESDYKVTLARYESLKKKLGLMNIDPEQLQEANIRTTISVYSPINGYVTDVKASRGMFLNPADNVLTIIDSDHLHLELNIFERDLPLIKPGQTIRFRTQNESNMNFLGEVHLVNNFIDPESRTANIHGHLNDDQNLLSLAPGMYVEAEILTLSDTLPALPQQAVINMDDKYFVLVKTSGENESLIFEQKEVMVGNSANGFTEIRNFQDFPNEIEFLVKGAFDLVRE